MNIQIPAWLRSKPAKWIGLSLTAIITLGSILISDFNAAKEIFGKDKGSTSISADQNLYTVLLLDEVHRVAICETTPIVDDPRKAIGQYGRAAIPYRLLSSNVPKVGEKFRLAPSKAGNGTWFAQMAGPPPDPIEPKAAVAKPVVTSPAPPKPIVRATPKPTQRPTARTDLTGSVSGTQKR